MLRIFRWLLSVSRIKVLTTCVNCLARLIRRSTSHIDAPSLAFLCLCSYGLYYLLCPLLACGLLTSPFMAQLKGQRSQRADLFLSGPPDHLAGALL